MNKLDANFSYLFKTALPLLIVISVSVFAIKFGLSKISTKKSEVNQAKINREILQTKLNSYEQVDQAVLGKSDISVYVLPDSNPSLLVRSQINSIAFENQLLLSGFKAGAEVKDKLGVSRVDISFDVDGSKDAIFNFLKSTNEISPLVLVEKVKIAESTDTVKASINASSYWSSLPEKLPPLDSKVNSLSQEDIDFILSLGNLRAPAFFSLQPSSEGIVADPFGLVSVIKQPTDTEEPIATQKPSATEEPSSEEEIVVDESNTQI